MKDESYIPSSPTDPECFQCREKTIQGEMAACYDRDDRGVMTMERKWAFPDRDDFCAYPITYCNADTGE